MALRPSDLPDGVRTVTEQIGDVRRGPIPGQRCREAIRRWGGHNAIQSLELRFREVAYFACSPLGRDAEPRQPEPFRGSGLLEPLYWVLTGKEVNAVIPLTQGAAGGLNS